MKHYAGIDVSLNSSSVCVVDESGKVVREVKVPSEPVALIQLDQIAQCESGADRAGSRPARDFLCPLDGMPGGRRTCRSAGIDCLCINHELYVAVRQQEGREPSMSPTANQQRHWLRHTQDDAGLFRERSAVRKTEWLVTPSHGPSI